MTRLTLRCVIVRRRLDLQTSILRIFTTALDLFWGVIERYQITTPTLRGWWFLHFLQLLCHKNAPNQLFMFWTHKTTQMTTKKFSKILRFFDFFLSIFLKIMFKNNVCVNLTTKTSKYRVEVSQLSLQCFSSFLLSLLSKNRSTFFFGNFFTWPWKIHIFCLGSKLKKRLLRSFYLFRATLCKNLSEFWNLT